MYISKYASEDQRNAVINIFYGKAKGDGQFALFAPTYKYILEPQYVDINKTINGKKTASPYQVSWMYSLNRLETL